MPTSREERLARVKASKESIDNAIPAWVPGTVTVPAEVIAEAMADVSDAEIAAVPHFPAGEPPLVPETPKPDIATMTDAEVEAEIRDLETSMGLPPVAEEAAAKTTTLDDLADLLDPPASSVLHGAAHAADMAAAEVDPLATSDDGSAS